MEERIRARAAPAVSARVRSFLILRFRFAAHSSCKGVKWRKRDREMKTLRLTIVPQPRTRSAERVYVNSDLPQVADSNGLVPWDRAQAPFLGLSKTFGDLVQGFLAQRFKGSPGAAQTASVRQLRTTAAPAIAVEISSVT